MMQLKTQNQYCTYKTYHPSGFYYYGRSTLDNIDADYKGSGRKLWAMWMNPKTPRHTWSCDIIETFKTIDECKMAEAKLVNSVTLTDGYCVNLMTGGDDGRTYSQLCADGTYGRDGAFPTLTIANMQGIYEDMSGIETMCFYATELHAALKVGSNFSTWFNRRVTDYGFIENIDYKTCIPTLKSEFQHGGQNKKEYIITVSMAKELAMVEKNQTGKDARKYFIDIERELQKIIKAQQPIQIAQIKSNIELAQQRFQDAAQVGSIFGLTAAESAKAIYRSVKKETGFNALPLINEALRKEQNQ